MTSNKHKIQLTPEEKKARIKNRKLNNNLTLVAILLCVIVVVFFVFNIGTIGFKKTATSGGDTLQLDTKNNLKNDQYIIGNNPTNVQKEYFEDLTESLKDNSEEGKLVIVENVVKCFISDFFTWTNKDGNYEVGGVQYIFGTKWIAFQEEARYKFYNDLDLYITQYGRENLLEVTSVSSEGATQVEDQEINGQFYPGYYIEASWEYKDSSKIDVSEFQNKAYFVVVDNNGRLEISQMQPITWK